MVMLCSVREIRTRLLLLLFSLLTCLKLSKQRLNVAYFVYTTRPKHMKIAYMYTDKFAYMYTDKFAYMYTDKFAYMYTDKFAYMYTDKFAYMYTDKFAYMYTDKFLRGLKTGFG